MSLDVHRIRRRAVVLSPVLGVTGVALVAMVLHLTLITCAWPLGVCQLHEFRFVVDSLSSPFDEFGGRMTWIASVFVLVTVCLGAIALIAALTWKRWKREDWHLLLLSLFALSLFLAFGPLVDVPLGKPLSADTIDRSLPVDQVQFLIQILAIVVIIILAFGVSTLLEAKSGNETKVPEKPEGGDSVPAAEDDIDERCFALANRLRTLRLLLVIGTTVLVTGVVQVTTVYKWSSSQVLSDSSLASRDTLWARRDSALLADQMKELKIAAVSSGQSRDADDDAGPALVVEPRTPYLRDNSQIVDTMGTLSGAFFSVLLAGIFVPAFLSIRAEAQALASERLPSGTDLDAGAWLEQRGLTGSLPIQVGSLLAVLGPLLAGGPGLPLFNAFTGQ